jgi:hypothetical protein
MTTDRESLREELAFLSGTFAGREEVHASEWAKPSTAASTADGRLELAGTLLVLRHEQVREDGADAFAVVNVFMRSPGDAELLLYAFDTAGYPPDPPARGAWQGTDLVLDRTTTRGSSRTLYTPTDLGYRWSKEFQAPGSDRWVPVVSGELQRRGWRPVSVRSGRRSSPAAAWPGRGRSRCTARSSCSARAAAPRRSARAARRCRRRRSHGG